jgi:hypothetical protein
MKQQISQLMLKKYIDAQLELPKYNPTADFEWIKTQSGLPWLPLTIEIPYDLIAEELNHIQHLLVNHRDDYAEHDGWKSFCIHGKSYDATREKTHYNDHRPLAWTKEAETLLPQTTAFFKNTWPATVYDRVRVMLLEPGGYIAVHSDYNDPRLWPINIAITQPKDCHFVMEKHGIVPFEPGSANWLDISNRHTVFNSSSEPRWHIIVHQDFDNIEFQKLVVNSYKKMYNNTNENSHNHNSRRSQHQD